MSKATKVCPSCSANNEPSSEFCIDCGSNIKGLSENSNQMTEREKELKEYRNWKKSVPYTLGASIFLIFIDSVTGGGPFDWSHWAVVPIIIFTIIAPYFSFKMGNE